MRLEPSLAAATLAVGLAAAAWAAPESELWDRWTAHDPASTAVIDHAAWDAFLGRYVAPDASGLHRARYAAVSEADRAALDAYLARLAATPISRFARAEQRAFWINLYNALTVDVVLDHYPVKSILKISISPGLFSRGPWGKPLIRVEGAALSLDDVEHRILRPIWRDPRIHYAVNCASVGCPNLALRAYTGAEGGAETDAMLDAGARAYVNSPRGVAIEDERLVASKIYDWFQSDFGGSEAGVIAHLSRYAEPALRRRLADFRSIDDYRYDWSLNDAAAR